MFVCQKKHFGMSVWKPFVWCENNVVSYYLSILVYCKEYIHLLLYCAFLVFSLRNTKSAALLFCKQTSALCFVFHPIFWIVCLHVSYECTIHWNPTLIACCSLFMLFLLYIRIICGIKSNVLRLCRKTIAFARSICITGRHLLPSHNKTAYVKWVYSKFCHHLE